ncbi:MAG: nucleotide sugar dehydrogenase [Candidatus Omnitrophota bacterium]|jgi:UDP-N-acetyl-D-glucosamine dehydrogenase
MNDTGSRFLSKVRNKDIRIAVVGLGYVGLPLAMEFAKKGISCLGIDVDKDRIEKIKRKASYITDVPTRELRDVVLKKKFSAEADFRSLKACDVVFICVPTPLKRKYHPDISYIKSAVRGISRNMKKGTLVILESTTYPGTTDEVILPLLESGGLKHGKDFYLCFSPERIDPGNKQFQVHEIPKVIGGIDAEATRRGTAVYQAVMKRVVPVSSSRVAEMVKLLENTFRLINIGMIDELAMMAHSMGIDIWEVIRAAKTKPFGFMPFYPGPGVGGHCIPKDPLYLYWKAKKFGFRSRFIKLASDIINFMPVYVVERVKKILKKNGTPFNKAKILVVGVTYKEDIKDLRKSPSLDIIETLQKNNISVSYYDPLIPYLRLGGIRLESAGITPEGLGRYDCVIIATAHSVIDYKFLLKNAKLIFDTRNVYGGSKNAKVHTI